jgi:hypothetical protein
MDAKQHNKPERERERERERTQIQKCEINEQSMQATTELASSITKIKFSSGKFNLAVESVPSTRNIQT